MAATLDELGISLVGAWPTALRANLNEALFTHIGEDALKLWLNNRASILHFGGPAKLDRFHYYGWTSGLTITFYANMTTNPVVNILHEFGHLVDNLWDDFFTARLEKVTFRRSGTAFGGWNSVKYLSLPATAVRRDVLKDSRAGGSDAWQQRGGVAHFEDWADIFSNAMLQNFNPDHEVGAQILDFVAQMTAHVKGEDAAAE